MNVPRFSDIGGTITGKKIENTSVTYEGPMYAKVIMPGTSEPEVQVVGEIVEAIVSAPRDPAPRPAEAGSWPRSESDLRAEVLSNAVREPQFWTAKQAKPKAKPTNDPEIL